MSAAGGDAKEFEDKPEFLDEKKWTRFKNIQSVHYHFDEITKTFEDEAKAAVWKDISTSIDPLNIALPIERELTPFQSL